MDARLLTALVGGLIVCQTINAQSTLRCDFDDPGLCGLRQEIDDDIDWTRISGKTPSNNQDETGPNHDHTGNEGHYIFIESSYPNKLGMVAALSTGTFGSGLFCVSFAYHMKGDGIGALRVYRSTDMMMPIFERTGQQGYSWQYTQLQMELSDDQYLIFEGEVGSSWKGDIALDDVSVQPGPCQRADHTVRDEYVKSFSCSFDDDTQPICDMIQDTSWDEFDWTRNKGDTPTARTGPSGDHTTGNGYYLYTEASPQRKGDTALLASPLLDIGQFCLEFWFHMLDANSDIGELGVYTLHGQEKNMLWSRTESNGPRWAKASIDVAASRGSRLLFNGTRGSDVEGDIGLDDITLSQGPCSIRGDATQEHTGSRDRETTGNNPDRPPQQGNHGRPHPPEGDGQRPPPPQDGDRPSRPQDGDRPPPPQDGDRPPRPQDGDRPPPSQDSDRPPRPQDGDGPPPSQDSERPPRPQDGDRPPPSQDSDRPPRPQDGDRSPPSQGSDRPPRPQDGDRPPPSQDSDRPPRPQDGDRPPRPREGDRSERPPRPQGGDRSERPPRPQDGDRSERPPRPQDGDRSVRPHPPQDGDRPSLSQDSDRPPRPHDGDRPERPPRPQDGDRSERPPRPHDGDRSERPTRPQDDDRSERPPRPQDGDRPSRPQDGNDRPFPPRDGNHGPPPPRDRNNKPPPPRNDNDRRPSPMDGNERLSSQPGQPQNRPGLQMWCSVCMMNVPPPPPRRDSQFEGPNLQSDNRLKHRMWCPRCPVEEEMDDDMNSVMDDDMGGGRMDDRMDEMRERQIQGRDPYTWCRPCHRKQKPPPPPADGSAPLPPPPPIPFCPPCMAPPMPDNKPEMPGMSDQSDEQEQTEQSTEGDHIVSKPWCPVCEPPMPPQQSWMQPPERADAQDSPERPPRRGDNDQNPMMPPNGRKHLHPPPPFDDPILNARLVDGSNDMEGRVEVEYGGLWGTVCSDGFDWAAANVVCRSLGFVAAVGVVDDGTFTEGTGPIVYDGVRCKPFDPSLAHCWHNEIGVHDCVHSQDVGVRCTNDRAEIPAECEDDDTTEGRRCRPNEMNSGQGPPGPGHEECYDKEGRPRPPRPGQGPKPHPGPGPRDSRICRGPCRGEGVEDIRLIGAGDNAMEGRLEVKSDGDEWGTVCNLGFNWAAANVACKQLGFMAAVEVMNDGMYSTSAGRVLLDGVRCKQHESSLTECCYNEIGVVASDCDHSTDVSIKCTNDRTEIPEECGDAIDIRKCRPYMKDQDDIPRRPDMPSGDEGGRGHEGMPAEARERPGRERHDDRDDRRPGRDDMESYPPPPPFYGVVPDVRLVGGSDNSAGRLEVKFGDDIWGTVCSDLFTWAEANVACRSLGFGFAIKVDDLAIYGPGSGPILMDGVKCKPHDPSLAHCCHNTIGVHDCVHGKDVAVQCSNDMDQWPQECPPDPTMEERKSCVPPMMMPQRPDQNGRPPMPPNGKPPPPQGRWPHDGQWPGHGQSPPNNYPPPPRQPPREQYPSRGGQYPPPRASPEWQNSQPRPPTDEQNPPPRPPPEGQNPPPRPPPEGQNPPPSDGQNPPPWPPPQGQNPPPRPPPQGQNPPPRPPPQGQNPSPSDGQNPPPRPPPDGQNPPRRPPPDGQNPSQPPQNPSLQSSNPEVVCKCKTTRDGHDEGRGRRDRGRGRAEPPPRQTPPPEDCELKCQLEPQDSLFDCDFENGYCRFGKASAATVWKEQEKSTPSVDTGPDGDHTHPEGKGHYIYLESSDGREGDNAILISPNIEIGVEACLEFAYHMRGATIGTLKVTRVYDGQNSRVVVFERSGQQGDSWLEAMVSLPSASTRTYLLIEAIKGSSYTGDIAIDDVIVRNRPCV